MCTVVTYLKPLSFFFVSRGSGKVVSLYLHFWEKKNITLLFIFAELKSLKRLKVLSVVKFDECREVSQLWLTELKLLIKDVQEEKYHTGRMIGGTTHAEWLLTEPAVFLMQMNARNQTRSCDSFPASSGQKCGLKKDRTKGYVGGCHWHWTVGQKSIFCPFSAGNFIISRPMNCGPKIALPERNLASNC